MTAETERAKQLADDHLSWVAGYNKALGLTMIPMAAAEYLYRTAIYHGYGHGCEDTRHGYPAPRATQANQDLILKTCSTCADTGCCNTGRTLGGCSLHTPLPPEEVERISGEVAPLPLLCKTCGQEDCSTNRMNECEKYSQCARWIEEPTSSLREQLAEAKEPQATFCGDCKHSDEGETCPPGSGNPVRCTGWAPRKEATP
jgi:hypothetical protein